MNPLLPPLSLYIHTPWCVEKCPYCDFNSHRIGESFDELRYVEALLADLSSDISLAGDRRIESIFIGGGTPSLFSGVALSKLLDGVRQHTTLAVDAEITLEANPGTVDESHFAGYRRAGVNRLSLGIQSFDSTALKRLGRIHDEVQALSAVATARAVGFENINLDLMFGLPAQSLEAGLADLRLAVDLNPAHLSWYQLTLEPNTPFASNPPQLPGDESIDDLFTEGGRFLTARGFKQYEVSAWACNESRCRHNVNYWQFGDYLGIGAGAHGKISSPAGNGLKVVRTTKHRGPDRYLKAMDNKDFMSSERILYQSDLIFEFMLNALRLTDGFSEKMFERRTGLAWKMLAERVQQQEQRGLLESERGVWRASVAGARFLNDLIAGFLPEHA